MDDKRYQVFIGSTFEDLKDERRAVQDVVINTGNFPVQMESFPAVDENQFNFIKGLIDKCDYYILIIAGRYGTVADDGLSYTHKEFKYAVSKGVPVLVMLHGARDDIPSGKSEKTEEGKGKLQDFIQEVKEGRICKHWITSQELTLAVHQALANARVGNPRVGWVRGDTIASQDVLEELNEVRKENAKLREERGELAISLHLPPIPDAESPIEIDLFFTASDGHARISGTWISVFPIYYHNVVFFPGQDNFSINTDQSCIAIGSALAEEIEPLDARETFRISNSALNRLTSFYTEAGLINEGGPDPFTEFAPRYARRQYITLDKAVEFALVSGSLDVGDDLPF